MLELGEIQKAGARLEDGQSLSWLVEVEERLGWLLGHIRSLEQRPE